MHSAGKRKSQKPAHGPPLQARVAAANGTVLQLANMLKQPTPHDDPGAHGNEQGQTKLTERGQEHEEGSGHDKGKQAHSPQNKPLQADTAGRRSARHRPQKKQPAVGRPHSKATAADDVGLPLDVQCRLMGGVQWCWPSEGGLRPTYPVSTPPIAFACHCTYPLP